jgi:hypothetical protein
LKHELVIVEGRQHQDLDIGPSLLDSRRRSDPVRAWHAEVHQDNQRLEFRRIVFEFDSEKIFGFGSVARFADDVQIAVQFQKRPQTFTHKPLIIDKQNVDRLALRHSRDRRCSGCRGQGGRC